MRFAFKKNTTVKIVTTAFLALFAVATIVYGQSFAPPQHAAPDNTGVNDFDELTGFLRLGNTAMQSLAGPLAAGSSLESRAWVGGGGYAASAVGSVSSSHPVQLSTLGVTGAALYGYADGGANAYGIFGRADGVNASAILGLAVDSAGFAARLYGPAHIQALSSELYVEETLVSPQMNIHEASASPSVESTSGTALSGPIENGVYGESVMNYGVYGYSDAATFAGINASSTAPQASLKLFNTHGLIGTSMHASNFAGIYGLSDFGNGVEARVGAESTWPIAQGTSLGSGSGVYGRGGAWAGYFEGDAVIEEDNFLSIGTVQLSEDLLDDLLKWCNDKGKKFCPDDSKFEPEG